MFHFPSGGVPRCEVRIDAEQFIDVSHVGERVPRCVIEHKEVKLFCPEEFSPRL